jgi:hypothetical protein
MTRRAPAWLFIAATAFTAVAPVGRNAPRGAEAVPPRLASLSVDEYRPAYLFYRTPAGAEAKDLRGKKQRLKGRAASLAGDATAIEVPAGTDVVLTATADRPLKSACVLPPRAGDTEVKAVVALVGDGPRRPTFRARLDNVRGPRRFVLEFTAADGAAGRREVAVTAAEDRPPEVEMEVEVVRKTRQGYLVTPTASIPFRGQARDDHGLESLAYVVTAARLGAGGQAGREEQEQRVPVLSFAQLVRQKEAKTIPLQEMVQRLEGPPPPPLVKEFRLDPDDAASALDLSKLPRALKEADATTIQRRYRLRVWLAATDNDVETGPHTARGKEPFTFVVVSENDLLAEVAREEEALQLKLEDEAKRLREARSALAKLNADLTAAKPGQLRALGERAEEVVQALERSSGAAREVQADYRRILRELRVNRVPAGVIKRVEKDICDPLTEALGRELARSEQALGDLSKALKGRDADRARKAGVTAGKQLDGLGDRLDKVVAAMQDLATVNHLIKMLKDLEEEQRKQEDKFDKLKGRK